MIHKCKNCPQIFTKKTDFVKHKNSCNKDEIISNNNTEIIQNESKSIAKNDKKNEVKCKYCKIICSKHSNLIRHLKICEIRKDKDKTEIIKKDSVISNTLTEMEFLKKELASSKEISVTLKKEMEFFKRIVISSGLIVNTAVNSMAYAIKQYADADPLVCIDNKKLVGLKLHEDDKLCNELVYRFLNNILDEYIGDIIINNYKNKDPEKQSLWTSDVSRLKFIVMNLVNDVKQWHYDENGVKICDTIVKPLLGHIRVCLDNRLKKDINKYLDIKYPINAEDSEIMYEESIKRTDMVKIIYDIDKKILEKSIIKYIAPHFKMKIDKIYTIDE